MRMHIGFQDFPCLFLNVGSSLVTISLSHSLLDYHTSCHHVVFWTGIPTNVQNTYTPTDQTLNTQELINGGAT